MNSASCDNKIRKYLENGTFLYTLEYVPDVKDESAARKGLDHLAREAELVGRDARVAGVNIGDRVSRLDTLDTVECGAIAAAASGKMPLLHLAGKDRNPDQALNVLQRANSLGLANYLLISGDRVVKPATEPRTRYHDSVVAIHDAKNMNPDCLVAAAVSPFKYREEELINQYLKMAKKINVGANYIITNCGWDMRKFQELAWYREARGFDAPIVANLLIPPLGWAKAINAGRLPGVHLTNDLLQVITAEHKLGKAEFERLSIGRAGLQIVGLKLMGYAGVHLSGVETYSRLRHAIEVADQLERDLPTMAEWKQAWEEAHLLPDRRLAVFGPAKGLYLFGDRAPGPGSLNAPPTVEGAAPSTAELSKSKALDRVDRAFFHDGAISTALLKPLVLSMDKTPVGRKVLLKTEHSIKAPLLGCEMCGFCRIPYLEYVCPETCPKGLANGPCSGTEDNVCEFKDRECIHNRKYRIAKARGTLADLEEVFVPAVNVTRGTSSWANQYRHSIPTVQRVAKASRAVPKSEGGDHEETKRDDVVEVAYDERPAGVRKCGS